MILQRLKHASGSEAWNHDMGPTGKGRRQRPCTIGEVEHWRRMQIAGPVLHAEFPAVGQVADIKAPVGEHNAFRKPGRAAGVIDACKVFPAPARIFNRRGCLNNVAVVQHAFRRISLACKYQGLKAARFFLNFRNDTGKIFIYQQDLCAGIINRIGILRR